LAERTAVSSGVGGCSLDSDALALVEVEADGVSVGAELSSSPLHPAVRTRTSVHRTAAGRVIVRAFPAQRLFATARITKRQIVIARGLGEQGAHPYTLR
jgi:hypothetical protein